MPARANQVVPGLWQGGAPATGESVTADLLVLCAQEYQPHRQQFPRTHVVRARMADHMPTPRELSEAVTAAREVVQAIKRGKCVLVTCMAGLNRSGLVTGLALRHMGYSGPEAVVAIKRARGDFALSNEYFRRIVETC